MRPGAKVMPIRKPLPRSGKNTRTRIVERSIVLFNRDGLQNVPIEQIASDLRISPGNLTYYFKRKRDLILATLEVLQEHLRIALARPVSVNSPRDGAEYIIRIFRTFWRFRFFFNALTYLLSNDPPLRRQFTELREWVIDTLVTDMSYLKERGYLIDPQPPNSFRLLATNLWALWLHWLRMTQIETPHATSPANRLIAGGVWQLWSMCQLWMPPHFAREMLAVFEDLLDSTMLSDSENPQAAKEPGEESWPARGEQAR